MKKPSWNPRAIWDSLKHLVTKNLWLKVLSLLLATATYSALKDKTTDHESDSTTEAEMYDSLLKRLAHTLQPEEKPQSAKQPEPKKAEPEKAEPEKTEPEKTESVKPGTKKAAAKEPAANKAPEIKKPVQRQNDK